MSEQIDDITVLETPKLLQQIQAAMTGDLKVRWLPAPASCCAANSRHTRR